MAKMVKCTYCTETYFYIMYTKICLLFCILYSFLYFYGFMNFSTRDNDKFKVFSIKTFAIPATKMYLKIIHVWEDMSKRKSKIQSN